MIWGNVLSTNMLRGDYLETDPGSAAFIHNKPDAAIAAAQAAAEAALPRTGGAMTGSIAMGGGRVTDLAQPQDSADAATKGYVDAQRFSACVLLPAALWSELAQTVSVPGVTAGSTLVVTAAPDSFLRWTDSMVYCAGQGEGCLTFRCGTQPEGDLSANILIFSEGG